MPLYRALLVLTNHSTYPSKSFKTGLWLNEATHFYDVMLKRGIEMDFVSPLGGNVPLDEKSLDLKDEVNRQYFEETTFKNKLENTLSPSQIDASKYQVIYFAGGHGTMWDFPDNAALQAITRTIYENNGIVAAVCHGVSALLNVKLSDGSLLIENKNIAGFTNLEERLVGLSDEVPFKLEDELKKRNTNYNKALFPFVRYIQVDERLITGQNPQSTKKVAQKVLEEWFDK